MDINGRIREFINSELAQGTEVGSDDSPLLDGTIDSVSLFRLVVFLEESFAVTIDDAEITPGHFSTVRSIGALVASRMGEPVDDPASRR
jgi:acyl carrier protein